MQEKERIFFSKTQHKKRNSNQIKRNNKTINQTKMDNPSEDPNAFGNQGGDDGQAPAMFQQPGEGGDDENVDQFYDDGGETFLPADHVSIFENCLL